MMKENIIIVAILVVIIASIVFYLVKEKKRGVTCVGCPHAKQCGGQNCASKHE